jgi:ribosomal protein L37AE/L43A
MSVQYSNKKCETCGAKTSHTLVDDPLTGRPVWQCEICGDVFGETPEGTYTRQMSVKKKMVSRE